MGTRAQAQTAMPLLSGLEGSPEQEEGLLERRVAALLSAAVSQGTLTVLRRRQRGGWLAERVVARLRLERVTHELGRVVLALDVHRPLAVNEVIRRGASERHLVAAG